MADIQCPYCNADVQICHDDGQGYEQETIHLQECGKCNNTFAFTTCISFDYSASKADCQNGGEHNFKPTHTFPKEYTRMRCSMCDEERSLTPEELKLIQSQL